MGFRFRKSVKLGPFRVNFSKSGVSYSAGVKGFRVTKKANGGYRTTASIPGTGIGYTKDYSGKEEPAEEVSRASDAPAVEEKKAQKKMKIQKPGASAVAGVAILALLGIFALTGGSESETPEIKSTETSKTEAAVVAQPSKETTAPVETEAPTETTTPVETEAPAETTAPVEAETPAEAPAPAAESSAPVETTAPAGSPAPVETTVPAESPAPVETTAPAAQESVRKVYRTKSGKRYHYDDSCNGGTYYEVTLDAAESAGLTPCQKCAGG